MSTSLPAFITDPADWPDYLWPNFPLDGSDQFTCRHCGKLKVYAPLMDHVQMWRGALGRPIQITSWHRCPIYNGQISSTGFVGPHTTGLACNIGIRGRDARMLLSLITPNLKITGVGIKQKGHYADRFLHVDMLPVSVAPDGSRLPGMEDADPRPWVWSY